MKLINWFLLVVTAATFAASLPYNKILIADFQVITVSASRALLAMPFICVITVMAGSRFPKTYAEWRLSIKGGLFLLIFPFCAIAFGQQYIPSGIGGILYGLMPLLTVIIASWFIQDERFSLLKLIGCIAGFIGTVLVFGPESLLTMDDHLLGAVVTLLAPLSYATGTVLLRKARPCDPLTLSSGMFMIGTLVLVPIAMVVDGMPEFLLLKENSSYLFGLATLGTAVPAFLNYVLIRRVGAVDASIVMFIMPIFAISAGVYFFDEQIGVSAVFGMTLIILACLAVTRFAKSAN